MNDSETFTSAKFVPYFFGYKTEFFVFIQNNPKTDLDVWDCLEKKNNTRIIAMFHETDLLFVVILESGNPSYS